MQTDCLALTRGDETAKQPIQIHWAMGGETPSDFIWTTSAHAIIVHRRVADLLREHGFTGWHTYPVHVSGKKGDTYSEYLGLAIAGRCGPVDLSRSIVVLSEYPAGWFPHFLGHYFDETSWDGCDLFMEAVDPSGRRTANIFATEPVRQVFRRAKIKNIIFERLTERSVNTSVYEIGSSHLLPLDFQSRVDAAYGRAGVPRPV